MVKKQEKETNDLRYQLESKTNEFEKLESDLAKLNETNQSISAKFDEIKKENCLLQNQIRVIKLYFKVLDAKFFNCFYF